MGCGSSQAVSVIEVSPNTQKNIIQTKNNEIKKNTEIKNLKKDHLSLIPLPANKKFGSAGTHDSGIVSSKENKSSDDEENISERRSSISSTGSGYFDQEYKHVITEKSKKDYTNKVEKEFREKDGLELSITGKSCPPLLSKKEKETMKRKEEQVSLEMLKTNGLVQKPVINKQNYALFEIVQDDNNPEILKVTNTGPPPRLLNREKLKPVLTAQEIESKLEKANQRKQEQLKSRVLSASISIDKKQVDSKSQIDNSKHSSSNYNNEFYERQKRLNELRDKLKAKDSQVPTPRTPRSKELVSELDKFRPKTASNFRPDF